MIKCEYSFRKNDGSAGFSLVEISLAMLVVSMGLLILMALLPAGLNEMESAVDNTRASMWADDLFNRIQANALLAQSRTEFELPRTLFENFNEGELYSANTAGGVVRWKYFRALNRAIPSTPIWRVRVEARSGGDGPFVVFDGFGQPRFAPIVFYTEIVYGATPP